MKTLLRIAFVTLLSGLPLYAQVATPSVIERWQADHRTVFDASEVVLDDLLWIARPIVVFADTPEQPAFLEQMAFLQSERVDLSVRDVIIIVDTDPSAQTEVRQRLRPHGFSLVLLDKDGRVILRKPSPWDVREISRVID
jgi:hypothetical protein